MASTENLALDTRYFCLFKGDPGAGKSIAAGSYPGHKENPNIGPYFFDNDRRIKSVVNYWRPRGREFHFDHFESFLELSKKAEDFYNFEPPYHTLVYDGITTGSDQILRDMIMTRPSSSKKVVRAGIEFLQIEDYGGEMRGLKTLLDNFLCISLRWGTNIIVTAHVLTTESKNIKTGQTTESRSLLTAGKKIAAALPVTFDEVYHFDVQPSMEMDGMPKYTIVTRNTGMDWAKTALPIDTRIDFTNKSLYEEITRQLEGKEFVRPVNDPSAPAPQGLES